MKAFSNFVSHAPTVFGLNRDQKACSTKTDVYDWRCCKN